MKQVRSQNSIMIAVSMASTMACSFPSFCNYDVDQEFDESYNQDFEDLNVQEERLFAFKSRLFFACQMISEFVNKFSLKNTTEEIFSLSLATYTRQMESYIESNLSEGLKNIMDKLSDISVSNRLIGECHLESILNLVKKKESEGSPFHQVVVILDPDSIRRMEGYMFLLVKCIPSHFIIMGNIYKEVNLHRMNKAFKNNQSSIIICTCPSLVKECVDKIIRNLNNGYSESGLLLDESYTFSIGGIPKIDVKLLNDEKKQDKLSKFSSIEVVGFLPTSQLNNFVGIGLDERYYLYSSDKSELLHMLALSMTQTDTAVFCMLSREFSDPIFGLICAISRGYMADCESELDELSLLLTILPSEGDYDTWKECLNYTVMYDDNNVIEDNISQKSLLTPWTSWNDAGSFSKDTAMQLKKFALRGLNRELDSEIERILDHASILGHRPHWLIDVLQYCASLSKTEDMAKSITNWVIQIKALYSPPN